MIPPDRAEKRNLAQFTRAPILEEKIDSAYMRFTDQTAQELLAASRKPDPDDPEQPGPFVEEWAAVAQALNFETSVRILTDLLGDRSHPYFYARVKGENLGVFDMVDDERLAEPFSIGSLRKVGSQTFTDIWCSFPTHSSQAEPAARWMLRPGRWHTPWTFAFIPTTVWKAGRRFSSNPVRRKIASSPLGSHAGSRSRESRTIAGAISR